MDRLLFIFMAVTAMILSGCEKAQEDFSPPQSTGVTQSTGEIKSGSANYDGTFNGFSYSSSNTNTLLNTCYLFLGNGNVKRCGRAYISMDYCVHNTEINLITGRTVTGTGTIIASNGDKMYFDFTGSSVLEFSNGVPNPSINDFSGNSVIRGGTGKFKSANGSLDSYLEYNVAICPYATSFRIEGAISY